MNKTVFLAFTAGACFGTWPIFMQRSGLNGYMQALVFSVTLTAVVTPFAYSGHGDLKHAYWLAALVAAVIGTLGTVLYTSAISNAMTTQQSLATVILIQVVIQSVVPVVWEVVQTKTISTVKMTGCALAIAALVCLTRK